MNYKRAMDSEEKELWNEAIEQEHDRMMVGQVWTPISKDKVNKNAKILTCTWAIKKGKQKISSQNQCKRI